MNNTNTAPHWNVILRAAIAACPAPAGVRMQLAQGAINVDSYSRAALWAHRETLAKWLLANAQGRTFRSHKVDNRKVWTLRHSTMMRAQIKIDRTEAETTEIILAHPAASL